MTIKEILLSDDIQRIEREIIDAHNEISFRYRRKDYSDFDCLLEIRKDLINKKVLKYQKELLPEIIEFNDTLRNRLQKITIRHIVHGIIFRSSMMRKMM